MELITKSFSVFLHPAQEFPKEKANVNFMKGLINYVVGGVILGVLGAISTYLMYTMFTSMIPAGMGGLVDMSALAPSLAVSTFFGAIIGAIIGPFIVHAILWIMAKILGGKGSYMEQYYMFSTFYVAYAVIAGVLMLIPMVGGFLGMLVGLYGLYLMTLALKETHAYSIMKAVLTWLIPVIVIGIILAVLLATLFAMLLGMVGAGGLGGLEGFNGVPY